MLRRYTPNEEVGLVEEGLIRLFMTIGVEERVPAAIEVADNEENVILRVVES